MKKLLLILAVILSASTFSTVNAQTKEQDAEITSDVPALKSFHRIIFPMWHKAYPAKDIEMLKGFVPQIKANMEKINATKLPGILREKEAKWNSELVKFNATAADYYKACEENNSEAILKAAEEFHRAYEAMNRAVKPFVKEMDEYHQTLYVIYHKYLTDKDYASMLAVSEKFVAQADAMTKAQKDRLEKRLKDKAPKYYDLSQQLKEATEKFATELKGDNAKNKEAALEKVHNIYKKLEVVFE